MHTYDAFDTPVLIVVRGIPGSGKSYLAAELQRTIGDERVVMLDPDATDYESEAYQAHTKVLTAEGVDEALHAYRFLRAQAYEGIEAHKVIIWNQPFTNLDIFHKMIARLKDHAAGHDTKLAVLVVEVEIDRDVARARVEQRKTSGGHGPSEQTLTRRMDDYKSFAGEGYSVVSVHGEDDIRASVTKILDALDNLADGQAG